MHCNNGLIRKKKYLKSKKEDKLTYLPFFISIDKLFFKYIMFLIDRVRRYNMKFKNNDKRTFKEILLAYLEMSETVYEQNKSKPIAEVIRK